MAIEIIKTKAERLAQVRALIHAIEDELKVKTEALEIEREILQTELLAELKNDGLASIKTENGDTYARSSKKSLDITNPVFALKWAKDNFAYSVDKRIALQKIAELDVVPDGFAVQVNEFISIRKSRIEEKELKD